MHRIQWHSNAVKQPKNDRGQRFLRMFWIYGIFDITQLSNNYRKVGVHIL